ncbi:MAG: Lsr2 family protein [Actinobacteria bacterium]|nr:Lsr2 family protein [Actinomycetota bacterium]
MVAVDDFVVALNPDDNSTLPYLVRLPLTDAGIVLKVRDTWPRTAKVFCHPSIDWPDEPEVVERVAVRSCVRRGAAIDLVLDRGRENRSQFVFTRARGREVIFWQSARTSRQARPNVTLPTRRASGQVIEILVDSHERYAWNFTAQQATTSRRALPAGDYAVELNDKIVASVERKSLSDLVSTMTTGKLRYLLAALAELPRAALVVEDRYSAIFKLDHARPAVVAEGLAEAQVRFPNVPVVFCETRSLAQEWTYRFLGAAIAHALDDVAAHLITESLPSAGPLVPPPASSADIRAWAVENGLEISPRGRVPASLAAAFAAAHGQG